MTSPLSLFLESLAVTTHMCRRRALLQSDLLLRNKALPSRRPTRTNRCQSTRWLDQSSSSHRLWIEDCKHIKTFGVRIVTWLPCPTSEQKSRCMAIPRSQAGDGPSHRDRSSRVSPGHRSWRRAALGDDVSGWDRRNEAGGCTARPKRFPGY